MNLPAPANGKYALRTGRVLDKPVAILEFSRLGTATPEPIEIEEVSPEDLVEEVDEGMVVTPVPPVIAKIVRTTHVEMPPVQKRARTRGRGPSVLAMVATVVLLAAVGAGAGFGMRALAQPAIVGASAALTGGVGAPGDREQRDRHAPRVPSLSQPPPSLAAPPSPADSPKPVGAVAPRVTKAAAPARASHAVHTTPHKHAAPAVKGAKKRAAH